jgi:hypothetical protein
MALLFIKVRVRERLKVKTQQLSQLKLYLNHRLFELIKIRQGDSVPLEVGSKE